MTDSPQNRSFLRLRWLVLFAVLAVLAAAGGLLRSYAARRTAAIAWFDQSGRWIHLGKAPHWVPDRFASYWPQWALPVEDVWVQSGQPFPHLRSIREVRRIHLGQAEIDRQQLDQLRSFPHLDDLGLESCGITDGGLEALRDCRNLRRLDLSDNPIRDDGLEQLLGLPLESLGLRKTLVTDAGLESLNSMPHLKRIYLARTAVGDAGLAHLARMPLEALVLSYTRCTGAGLTVVRGMPHLTVLYLDGLPLGDADLELIGQLRNLKELTLAGTHVTDAGVAHLAGLRLTCLDLSDTQISNASLELLEAQSSLEFLGLSRTGLTLKSAKALADRLGLTLDSQGDELELTRTHIVSTGTIAIP